jgi:hypothetical protein
MQTQISPAIAIPLAILALIGIFLLAPWGAGIVLAIGLVVLVGAILIKGLARPKPGEEIGSETPGRVNPQSFGTGEPRSGEG